MWCVVGSVVAVLTRLFLNRLLRRYLKESVPRVAVSLTEGRLEIFDISLDLESVVGCRVESCHINKIEIHSPRLTNVWRKNCGFTAVVSGVSCRLKRPDVDHPDEQEKNAVVEETTTTWRSKFVSKVRAWFEKRVFPHSVLRIEDVQAQLDSISEREMSQTLHLRCSSAVLLRGEVSWVALSLQCGQNRCHCPGGYVKMAARHYEIHLNEPRCDISPVRNFFDAFLSKENHKSRCDETPISFFVSVKGMATLRVSLGADEDALTARLERARLDLQGDDTFSAVATAFTLDGPLTATLNQPSLCRRNKHDDITLAASPKTCAVVACRDSARLVKWIQKLSSSFSSSSGAEPGIKHASKSSSRGARSVRVDLPGGAEIHAANACLRCSKPTFLYDLVNGTWTALSTRLEASSQDIFAVNLDEACCECVGSKEYKAKASQIEAIALPGFNKTALTSLAAELFPKEHSSSTPAADTATPSSTAAAGDTFLSVEVDLVVVKEEGGEFGARLEAVEYRLNGQGSDSATFDRVNFSHSSCAFEGSGHDLKTRLVSDEDDKCADNDSTGAAIEVKRTFHDTNSSTVSVYVRRGLLRLSPDYPFVNPLFDGESATRSSEEVSSASSLERSTRIYLALYGCEVEYAPALDDSRDVEVAIGVGFARFGAMLADGRLSVASTRVRDVELDALDRRHSGVGSSSSATKRLCQDEKRARLATLDVFDAFSKVEEAASSVSVTLGTLRLYFCHDSLQTLVDVSGAMSRDIRGFLGVNATAVESNDAAASEEEQDSEFDTRLSSSSSRGAEYLQDAVDLLARPSEEDEVSCRSLSIVEDYVRADDDDRPAKERQVVVSEKKRRTSQSSPSSSRMVVMPLGDEFELGSIDSHLMTRRDDDATTVAESEDDDEDEDRAGLASWYGEKDPTENLVHEHFQKALDDGGVEGDDGDVVGGEEPEFRFELKSTSLCCRLFAGSDWEYALVAPAPTAAKSGRSPLLTSLLDDDTASSVATTSTPRRRRRSRNIEKLCEIVGSGLQIRFSRPTSDENFRLDSTLKDFRVLESVSTDSGVLHSALEHWQSNSRHPRQTKDPMLKISANCVTGTTLAKLRLLPLRCRLDAEFLRYIDAFFGTLDLPDDDDDGSGAPSGRSKVKGEVDRDHDAVWVDADVEYAPTSTATNVAQNFRARRGEASLAVLEVAPWKLKLDYVPRGVDASALRRGSLGELLHLFALERVELELRRCRETSTTLSGALERVRSTWASELREEQLHRFFAGAEPVRPLAAIGASAVDVVAAPVAENLKKRGRPLRQLGVSTATLASVTALEATRASRKVATRVADSIDGMLPLPRNAPKATTTKIAPPRDTREGLERARDALKRGFDGATDACSAVVAHPSAATLAASFPVALLQPVVGATRGLAWILLGLEAAMESDDDDLLPTFFRKKQRTSSSASSTAPRKTGR